MGQAFACGPAPIALSSIPAAALQHSTAPLCWCLFAQSIGSEHCLVLLLCANARGHSGSCFSDLPILNSCSVATLRVSQHREAAEARTTPQSNPSQPTRTRTAPAAGHRAAAARLPGLARPMAFEMSLPHAPRIQAVGADGTETLAQDEQQWDLYFTVQKALAAQQVSVPGGWAEGRVQRGRAHCVWGRP